MLGSYLMVVPRVDSVVERTLNARHEDENETKSVYKVAHVEKLRFLEVAKYLDVELYCPLSYVPPSSLHAHIMQRPMKHVLG